MGFSIKIYQRKGEKTQEQLKTDSKDWGNYKDINFTIERGKYTILNTSTGKLGEWNPTNSTLKSSNSSMLLTTGATDRNSVLGIYDLAGNAWEWTLEYTVETTGPCAIRGGSYYNNSSSTPAFYRGSNNTDYSNNRIGCRSTLW